MAGPIQTFAGFEILGELGRGTTGIIYHARDPRLQRSVALKVPVIAPEPERAIHVAQFLWESRAVAYLSCVRRVGIPALYAVSEYQGRAFYIRELIEGLTLEQKARDGAIDLRAGLSILAGIAGVVQWVHEQGFIHRNLSPANVLVGRDGAAWLIGFGRVGVVEGSEVGPVGAARTTVDVDVRELQNLVRWLCGAIHRSIPAVLERIIAPGAFGTAGSLGEALTWCC